MSQLTPDALDRFREVYGESAMVVGFIVGIVVGSLHWVGLVVAGLIVGIVAPSMWRAIQYGLYVGGLVLFAFALWLIWMGSLGRAFVMGELTALALIVTFALPTVAAGGIRGLV